MKKKSTEFKSQKKYTGRGIFAWNRINEHKIKRQINTLVISKGKHWEQRKQQNEMVGNNGNKGTNVVYV